MVCETCEGSRVVRRPDGSLARCRCYWEAASAAVPDLLRHGEAMLLDGWESMPIWPLTSRTVVGGEADYHVFRSQAWRSLLAHTAADHTVRATAMAAGRIAEIHFQRDDEFRGYYDLTKLRLLVLIAGRMDVPSTFTVELTRVVLALREASGKPSWVFTTHRSLLGRSMTEVIQQAPLVHRDAVDRHAESSTRLSARADAPPKRKRARPDWRDD